MFVLQNNYDDKIRRQDDSHVTYARQTRNAQNVLIGKYEGKRLPG
jgi:hypothetical protein